MPPRRSNIEPTQTRFGSFKGSMRRGFESLRKTLKKQDLVVTETSAEPLKHPLPTQKQEEERDKGGVSTKSEATPLELAPPRMRIRNPRRDGIIVIPDGDTAGSNDAVTESTRRLKIKRPVVKKQEPHKKKPLTPPPGAPRSFHSGERDVEFTMELETTIDILELQAQTDPTAKQSTSTRLEVDVQPEEEVEAGSELTNAIEESTPSSVITVWDASAAGFVAGFDERVHTLRAHLAETKAKLTRESESSEDDAASDGRAKRIREQISALQDEVASTHDQRYILSDEEIASIDREDPVDNVDSSASVEFVQGVGDRLIEQADALIREETERQVPANAPRAPRAMLERQAQRANSAQLRQTQPWIRNNGPRSYIERQVDSAISRPVSDPRYQRRPYNSRSMPRGGLSTPALNPARRYNSQSIPRDGFPSTRPRGPMHYQSWTMPRGGFNRDRIRRPPLTTAFEPRTRSSSGIENTASPSPRGHQP